MVAGPPSRLALTTSTGHPAPDIGLPPCPGLSAFGPLRGNNRRPTHVEMSSTAAVPAPYDPDALRRRMLSLAATAQRNGQSRLAMSASVLLHGADTPATDRPPASAACRRRAITVRGRGRTTRRLQPPSFAGKLQREAWRLSGRTDSVVRSRHLSVPADGACGFRRSPSGGLCDGFSIQRAGGDPDRL